MLLSRAIGAEESLVTQNIGQGSLVGYGDGEKRLIEQDLASVGAFIFNGKKPSSGQPVYLATCGEPGSSKSTILETFYEEAKSA